jgi:hypothetical protein
VVQPDIGDGWGDKQRELPDTHHILMVVRDVEANQRLHPLVVGCRTRGRWSRRHHSAQGLDDVSGRNVLGNPIHDMEHLAMLIGAGVGAGVVIEGFQCPLGILVIHLVILVMLWIHLLFALPLMRRHIVLVWLLLLLLMDLLHKLLDLPGTPRRCGTWSCASGIMRHLPP